MKNQTGDQFPLRSNGLFKIDERCLATLSQTIDCSSLEYAMTFMYIHVIPDFKKKILLYRKKNHFGDKNYANKKVKLFCRCIQYISGDKWDLCAV